MEFQKIASYEAVTKYLVDVIAAHLKRGDRVLWLVSGGSAIKLEVDAAKKLLSLGGRLKTLEVLLSDERFVAPHHPDSNWQQLKEAGFPTDKITLGEVLNGAGMAVTQEMYAKELDGSLNSSDYSIAVAGLGADGHTFGVKPGSPAVISAEIVLAYKWDDYTRLTPTLKTIARLDEVILYAVGKEKHAQIQQLSESVPADVQPAQGLKKVKKVIIFNDLIGDEK